MRAANVDSLTVRLDPITPNSFAWRNENGKRRFFGIRAFIHHTPKNCYASGYGFPGSYSQ